MSSLRIKRNPECVAQLWLICGTPEFHPSSARLNVLCCCRETQRKLKGKQAAEDDTTAEAKSLVCSESYICTKFGFGVQIMIIITRWELKERGSPCVCICECVCLRESPQSGENRIKRCSIVSGENGNKTAQKLGSCSFGCASGTL